MSTSRVVRRWSVAVVSVTASVAVVLGLLVAASPAARGPSAARMASTCAGPVVGAQVHALWDDVEAGERGRVFDAMATLGMRTVRVDVSWAALEPEQGRYDPYAVARLEEVVDQALQRGLEPLVMLWLTPGWANGGAGERVAPDDPAAYGEVAGWAAERFPRVRSWQVWNEPNSEDFLVGADPATYAALLREAHDAMHRVRADVQVVFGGPAYQDVEWISAAYDAGAGGHFDVMATHGYQGVGDEPPELEPAPGADAQYRLRAVEDVRDLMVARGDAGLPVWFTELGWSSHASGPGATGVERGVTEAQQADYAVRTLQLLQQEFPYVERVYWYNAQERDSGDARIDGYGLLEGDLTPKPVARALGRYLQDCGG